MSETRPKRFTKKMIKAVVPVVVRRLAINCMDLPREEALRLKGDTLYNWVHENRSRLVTADIDLLDPTGGHIDEGYIQYFREVKAALNKEGEYPLWPPTSLPETNEEDFLETKGTEATDNEEEVEEDEVSDEEVTEAVEEVPEKKPEKKRRSFRRPASRVTHKPVSPEEAAEEDGETDEGIAKKLRDTAARIKRNKVNVPEPKKVTPPPVKHKIAPKPTTTSVKPAAGISLADLVEAVEAVIAPLSEAVDTLTNDVAEIQSALDNQEIYDFDCLADNIVGGIGDGDLQDSYNKLLAQYETLSEVIVYFLAEVYETDFTTLEEFKKEFATQ